MNIKKTTLSAEETEKAGSELAKAILFDGSIPKFIALYGDLGVGKTAFVRGFVREIAPTASVKSPTFTLVNEYRSDKINVFHFDMYRIEDDDSLYSIGFYDYLDKGICITEWTENIEFALPDNYLKVVIEKNNPNIPESRSITVESI